MSVIADVESQLAAVLPQLAARAASIDRGQTDPIHDLRMLAEELALFDVHATALPHAVAGIEAVSRHSLAVGFLAWGQRMAAEYLRAGPDTALLTPRLAEVINVQRRGVSAMAAGQRQAVGLGRAPVTAMSHGAGGYRLNGEIAWASNVDESSVIVLAANLPDGQTRVVMVAGEDVDFLPAPPLLALDATASGSLRLNDVAVTAEAVIHTDLRQCLAGIRPRFLLLQSAFCSGVVAEALTAASPLLTGTAELYAPDHAELSRRYRAAHDRLHSFAHRAEAPSPDLSIVELLELRLELADLAAHSTRLGLNVAGGRGYAVASAANRRFREAAFLPVQSPSESQLRWELARARGEH